MARKQHSVTSRAKPRSQAKKPSARPRRRSRSRIKQTIERAFRAEFPTDTVDISDGYRDNIHILIVSRRFDAMSEADKRDMMWTIIDETDLTDAEKSLISLVMPVSPAEIK